MLTIQNEKQTNDRRVRAFVWLVIFLLQLTLYIIVGFHNGPDGVGDLMIPYTFILLYGAYDVWGD